MGFDYEHMNPWIWTCIKNGRPLRDANRYPTGAVAARRAPVDAGGFSSRYFGCSTCESSFSCGDLWRKMRQLFVVQSLPGARGVSDIVGAVDASAGCAPPFRLLRPHLWLAWATELRCLLMKECSAFHMLMQWRCSDLWREVEHVRIAEAKKKIVGQGVWLENIYN